MQNPISSASPFRSRPRKFHVRLAAFLLLSAISLWAVSLPACGRVQNPRTIKIWEYPRWRESEQSVDRFYWMKQQILEFERLHPGVSIELTELTWEHGEDKKKIAISAGVGPDIITGTLPVQLVEAGLVEPVEEYLPAQEQQDFLPPAVESLSYQGKLYGWPWYLTGSVLIANLDLLEKQGVAPPEPEWDNARFLEIARRLTRDSSGDGRPDSFGFGFSLRPGDTSVWPFLFPAGIHEGFGNAGSRTLLTESDAAFLHTLVQRERLTPPHCVAWDAETMWQRFTAQRDIGIAPWGIWAIPRLRALDDFTFDVLPFPAPKKGEAAARAFVGASGFFVLRQSDPERRRLCMEFAEFLVRPEAQRDLALYGVIPSRISAGDIYHDDPVMAKVQRILTAGQAVPRHPQWAKIDENFQRELQLAFLGEKSLTAAIAESSRNIERIISKEAIAPRGEQRQGATPQRLFGAMAALCAVAIVVFFRLRRTSYGSAFAFLLPALLIFAVFLLLPLCWVLFLAFQDVSFAQARPNWVGMRNLAAVYHDPVFRRSAVNTVVYAVVVVPANVLSALVVASLIHPLSKRARSFFRIAYYLPGVASVVVLTMAWRWMFNENFGILNAALDFAGLPGIRWLTSARVALWSVILTSIARPPGGPILIYLAALDAIPTSLYDAGELDGASPLRKWWHITVPLLRPTTLFLILTLTIASFQVFTQVFILTGGGPGYATEVVAHQIYATAIRDFDFGAAAAMSLFLFAVIMLASIVQYRFLKSDVQY